MIWNKIPTALSAAETRALQEFAQARHVVECGSLLGYSTIAMAQVAANVVAIDKHEGYGPSTLHQFLSNIEGRFDRITPVVADCLKVLPYIKAPAYFIDLDGTHQTTKAALNAIQYGDVAVHDFNRNNCPGVELAIKDAGWTIRQTVDTLAFLKRGQ